MLDDKILRQRICEEILAYGESKREGPDLTLTIDRILTAFELHISALSSQPDEKLDADNKAVQLVEAYLREAYHDDTETPHFTAWAIDILSLAAPIMAARVEEARKLSFNPDWETDVQAILQELNEAREKWCKEKKEAVEQAHTEERKAERKRIEYIIYDYHNLTPQRWKDTYPWTELLESDEALIAALKGEQPGGE